MATSSTPGISPSLALKTSHRLAGRISSSSRQTAYNDHQEPMPEPAVGVISRPEGGDTFGDSPALPTVRFG